MTPDKPFHDFESIMIGHEMDQVRVDPATPKLLDLKYINLVVNLYSSVITNKNGDVKIFAKATSNNRE